MLGMAHFEISRFACSIKRPYFSLAVEEEEQNAHCNLK
jgi:hypothetical protein